MAKKFILEEDAEIVGEGENMRLAKKGDGGRKSPTRLLGRKGQGIDADLAERLGLLKKPASKQEEKKA